MSGGSIFEILSGQTEITTAARAEAERGTTDERRGKPMTYSDRQPVALYTQAEPDWRVGCIGDFAIRVGPEYRWNRMRAITEYERWRAEQQRAEQRRAEQQEADQADAA